MGDEERVCVTSMPSSVAVAGPVKTARAQMASRADYVSPPSAISDRTSVAMPEVCALGTSNLVGRKVPAGRWGPGDIATASAIPDGGKRQAPPGWCAAVAGSLYGQDQGVVE